MVLQNSIGNRKERIIEKIAKQPRPDHNLKRCTRCLLPETFPFITFNDEGVCCFCQDYVRFKYKGKEALQDLISRYRSGTEDPDCLVGFSGGRDSSFLLHYLKTEMGMNPIAFTYDWGMVTDLGYRNQELMCDKLGIEHIIVKADITKKMVNIRKNIEAWLKRPELGMVPLFMAGDKQFYYFAHKVMQQTGVKIIFSGAHIFEKTGFKLGFCGIKEGDTRDKGLLSGINMWKKILLLKYYLTQFITNLAYINSSLYDTLHAFYSTYVLPDAYVSFYNYISWNEYKILNVLKNEYEWETAEDTEATWRIGDGTAAFYNYIYYTIAGFSEFDTFRSNQIREDHITREEGMRLIQLENRPRYESLEWYSRLVGFDLEKAIDVIHSVPKYYLKNI